LHLKKEILTNKYIYNIHTGWFEKLLEILYLSGNRLGR
jgi:hypothetical protein